MIQNNKKMTNVGIYMLSDYVLDSIIRFLLIVVPLLIAIAYFTLFERKVMAAMHKRRGPNVVGYLGLLQPFADGLKLFVKELVLPSNANLLLFIMAPMISFFLSLISWAVIPFASDAVYVDLDLGLLFILAISSLSVYGIIIAGWASNSKYAFLGALRSTAQMISYEVSIGFLVVSIILCTGSFNLGTIVLVQRFMFFFIPLFPVFILFFVSTLAETNRHPFDLPEAESELVSGFNVEYSGFGFTLFFLGEYSNMLLMSSLNSILFLGGWLPMITFFGFAFLPEVTWFSLKIMFYVFLFVACRAAFPRYRYDQLMHLGWKIFLPISLFWLIVTSTILYYIQGLPL